MLNEGKLSDYLLQLDRDAEDMFNRLVNQMAEREMVYLIMQKALLIFIISNAFLYTLTTQLKNLEIIAFSEFLWCDTVFSFKKTVKVVLICKTNFIRNFTNCKVR